MDFVTPIETERLCLRGYTLDDAPWYRTMCQKNRAHLSRYERGNAAMTIHSDEDARTTLRDFAAAQAAGKSLFLGAFSRATGEFVAQIYIGVVDRDLPEFVIGYFADVDHEGQGYVAEAVRATLRFLFEAWQAQRVSLECDDTNQRSQRVAEHCGLVCESYQRENKRHADGTLTGTLHFGMFRRDFN